MKKLYLVGGTMGVGKTAVCRELVRRLPDAVFLDGDWCWDAHPFRVTEETKEMVLGNICFLLNQFLACSAYRNIVFCWVMHRQEILDRILAGTDRQNCSVKAVSLLCSPDTLRERLAGDIRAGIREPDIIARALEYLPLYDGRLSTVKVETDGKTVTEVAEMLLAL